MQTTAVMPARADPAAAAARADPPAEALRPQPSATRVQVRAAEPLSRERPNRPEAAATALQDAVARAAKEYFQGREIEVRSSFDEDSGRFVHKVMDRATGDVIAQSPPEELLRFFASGRAELPRPWLQIEA